MSDVKVVHSSDGCSFLSIVLGALLLWYFTTGRLTTLLDNLIYNTTPPTEQKAEPTED
jgi:hypothetical protein